MTSRLRRRIGQGRVMTLVALMCLGLSACGVTVSQTPATPPAPGSPQAQAQLAAANFRQVVNTVEPVAEAECKARTRGANCDFKIVVDPDTRAPANAFQTLDKSGRPVIVFTLALIADVQNRDELAFVLSHEAAHHILGHLQRQARNAQAGALILGGLVAAAGAPPEQVAAAADQGAFVGARSYSKTFELEADALGTIIAFRAGYDPERGAAYFDRLPDPGDQFLGTHPPNAQRSRVVRETMERLTR
ncbi:MAG: M48 family metalloprotease [Marinibacterium sp.]|nr:M48 family metalloprotease [Marinibacterium sp.]